MTTINDQGRKVFNLVIERGLYLAPEPGGVLARTKESGSWIVADIDGRLIAKADDPSAAIDRAWERVSREVPDL